MDATHLTAAESHLLHDIQCRAFNYFLLETNRSNGLVIDKTADNWPASIAATGLGLTAYPVGVERGYISREDAAERTLTTLRFFWNSHQGPEPDATGYKGFYYHFLDFQTGTRAWECELSTVDSALLFGGMLTAAEYFDGNTPAESEIRDLAKRLYERADWNWARNGGATVTHGWKAESGFLPFRWQGYDEAMLLYVLALGSPTHAIPASSYDAWVTTYEWKSFYNIDYLYAGPLFTHQLSHVWIDFRGIQDAYMKAKGIDYFENSARATRIQQEYAVRNPGGFKQYSELCWGVTASDGPGEHELQIDGIKRTFFDYKARAVPYGPDDGTIAPWAVVASLPFAPEIVLPTLADFDRYGMHGNHKYGFKATFNPTFPTEGRPGGWVSPWHIGINEGPIVAMIENYQTGLVWRLMSQCRCVANGLRAAGFSGGWLSPDSRQGAE
jgi:hypothetical protein